MEPIDDDVVLDLLERWEEARTTGTEIPVEELCRDHPELTAIMRAKISALKASDWMEPDRPTGPRIFAGRYRLERLVGQGGYGQIWLASDEELQRPVAIKIPKTSRRLGDQQIDQLLTEARRVARLRHPGIVTVHDVLKEGAGYVIVSDFIEGEDLAERLRRGPLSVTEVVKIVAQVARILDYGHGQGIVHRDIKPSNILLDTGGTPHVCDFGIAATRHELLNGSDRRATLAYASPEQLGDGTVDHRTDIWSLGVTMVEMITGRRPFDADDPVRLRQAILAGGPLSIPGASDVVAAVCQRCLATKPEDRFARGHDLADALEAAAQPKTPRQWPIALGIVAFIVVTIVTWAAWPERMGSPTFVNKPDEPVPTMPVAVNPPRDDAFRILRGHEGAVRSVDIARDGSLIASGGDDGKVRLWPTAGEITVLDHDGAVNAVLVGRRGHTVLSGTAKGTVTLWGLPPRTHKDRIASELRFLLHPFGGPWSLLANCAPRPVAPWKVQTFSGQVGSIKAVALSPDSRFLAWVGAEKLEVWEVGGTQPLTVARTPGETIHQFAFLKDGTLRVAFGFGAEKKVTNRTVLITKVNDNWTASVLPPGKNLELFSDVRGFVTSLDLATVLFTQSVAVRVFTKTNGGEMLLTGSYESPKVVLNSSISLRGDRAVTVAQDRKLRFWLLKNQTELSTLQGHDKTITAIAASENGQIVATASEDGTVRLWKTPSDDREMAERVLELGGTVVVDEDGSNRKVKVRKSSELPLGDFRLTEVDLADVKTITDGDVDRLLALTPLRVFKLPEIDKGFLLNNPFTGLSSDNILNRLRFKTIDGTAFTGEHEVLGSDGAAKHRAKVSGTVSHGELRYVSTRADIVKDGGHQPIRVHGVITRSRLKVTWELLEGNARGVIIMRTTAKE